VSLARGRRAGGGELGQGPPTASSDQGRASARSMVGIGGRLGMTGGAHLHRKREKRTEN
jgi:hypothetical protein